MSFNAFMSKRWKIITRTLPCGAENDKEFGSISMKKHCIEHYFSVVNGFREAMEKARSANFSVPFVSANIDLYRNKCTKSKYFCMRLHFVEQSVRAVY